MITTPYDDNEAMLMLMRSVLRGETALGRVLRDDEVALIERAILIHLAERWLPEGDRGVVKFQN